ncbi:hypothetical protein HY621_04330 [Candidatus Uhrbacteria bacterium]|nr:hypothetical protein [Candidatus Uhrbacteria bacterium]
MSLYLKENIIKNIVVILIATFLLSTISEALTQIKVEQMNDFLLMISMLLVTVSFANFAFTYEKSKLKTISGRFLSHTATGIFMLLTALLLESMVFAVQVVYPFFYPLILWFSLLLYCGIILYDAWDIARAEQ